MTEKIKDKIDVFCSVSPKRMKEVERWLIPSLERQKSFSEISLWLINYTGEEELAYQGPARLGKVSISEINKKKQCGFGESHNFAFKNVNPDDYFAIVNPDVYLHESCLGSLVDSMVCDHKIGIVESGQLPFEHPKEYDKKTGETPWASGSCMLLRSEFFKKVGGFDENFWMYCEDVDLSWKAWLAGYKVIYEKNAVAYHFTGLYFGYRPFRYYIENFWGARNFIYILYKYWGKKGEKRAKKYLAGVYPESFEKEVLRSFDELKKKIQSDFYYSNKDAIKKLKGKIKVTGYNQFHDLS